MTELNVSRWVLQADGVVDCDQYFTQYLGNK